MMKNHVVPAILTALIILLGRGAMGEEVAGAAAVAVATDELTAAQARADFDLMRHGLEEAHSGLYRYSTKAETDRAFDAQRKKLNHPMKRVEFLPILQETLARIRCGHTTVAPDEPTRKAMANARMFPLRVLVEGERLMVVSNDAPTDQTFRPGMEIVEINGHKSADILRRFWPFISADGDIETGKRHDIAGRFAQFYWLLVEQSSEFTVKAAGPEGKVVIAKLAGVTEAERKSNHNPVNEPIRAIIAKMMGDPAQNLLLRFVNDPQIAVIHMRNFVGDDYPQWMQNTFKTLREKKTQSLIIDLRGNGGGEDMYGAMLVGYLTDKPFRYFDRIDVKTFTPSFKEYSDWRPEFEDHIRQGMTPNPAGGYWVKAALHRGVAEQLPEKESFAGKVFVLIDGGTFSTAADFCAVTHHLKRATFIGQETGGGYYGNNSGMETTLTLPNSKFRVAVPMYEYWNAVPGYAGKRRGTIPDHVVEFRTADVLRGVDAPLDMAIKLAATPTRAK